MQVGDLVELSSAGSKNQQNMAVYGKIGLLVQINKDQYPYVVEWYGVELGQRASDRKNVLPCKRYELKKVRSK
tara:strand:+ start:532 stop:750 length:219 start_codon:yes stop_codon:yes gene_type:complete